MARRETPDIRGEIVDLLLQKVATDRHPSSTMMNFIEELITPDEVSAYAGILMDKVKTERYPSLPMIRRLLAFT